MTIRGDLERLCDLANPQEVKNRRGHKTDDKDGWWLAHLLRHAMIHPSFIPPRPIRELRDLTRRRKRLLSAATSEKNRVQKVLEDANVKMGSVLSDVFGVSGQLMLEELLKGQAPPNEVCGAGATPREEEDSPDHRRAGRTSDECASPAHDPQAPQTLPPGPSSAPPVPDPQVPAPAPQLPAALEGPYS